MRVLTGGLLLTLLAAACKTTTPTTVQTVPAQPVLLTLGNRSFTTDDFFQSFTKNQLSADSVQRTDVRNYFDLYTNLKLKVLAAQAEGRDTTEAFREEIATYRKQLAQSYLTDKVLIESLAAEAYQRMQQEVNASHLLVAVSEDAAPADTAAAYQQAMALRQRAMAGEDFVKLVRENSKDQATAATGGNLGYFSTFFVVYPLETAAYATPVGSVSQPVRTRYGYDLLKINDRRPSRGTVRVAHILVRLSPTADEAGQQAAKQRIDAVYERLQKGEPFDEVCRDVSDDLTSKLNGGVLPLIETGRQVPPFEEAAFALTKPGELSKPVRTNYGWHILKLIDRRGVQPYADLAASLRQRVATDSRGEVLRQAVLQRLTKTYPVQPNAAVLTTALTKADSSLLRGQWRYTEPLDPALQNKPLVTIGGQPYTVNQFFAYVRQKQQPARKPNTAAPTRPAEQPLTGSPAVAMQHLYDRYVGDRLLATEESNLEQKSSEFRSLMNEIRDGVLMSQVMEEHVWGKSIADSAGQLAYYEQHKDRYQFPERIRATVITAPTDAQLTQAREWLGGKAPYSLRRTSPALVYAPNQTTVSAKDRESLYEVVVNLSRNPDYIVEVAASHDPTERDSVSAGRIRNAVAYLRQNGIGLGRIMEKDYQGTRPGEAKQAPATQRRLTFQYFSTSKADVVQALTGHLGLPTDAITVSEGLFAKGANPYVDSVNPRKPGTTTTLRPAGKVVSVQLDQLEPARPKTFAEARGSVINDYQAQLEQQWLAQLRQQYPAQINDTELRKLAK
ncbi:peptidylprolyl isomerase [Spirosoma rhododendri]|uniref:Peptidylprolyl isomerase n=1 Tax=Spirosoma rhododendri TaxID=2728024 RepID=A0A7L5DTL9_9BACT|nr:peptidylprolyl isomerase [Spirosoma rhododendri]QJD79948.1 peptidylprolyl isomerase [Spirosoma rhododendri]